MRQLSLRLLAFALFMFPVAVFAQQPPISKTTSAPAQKPAGSTNIPSGKVVIIDTSRFSEGIDEYKKQVQKLEAEFAPRTKDLETKQKRYQELAQKLQSTGLTPDAAKKIQEEGESLEKELKRLSEDYQTDLQKKRETVLGPLSEKIYRFLQDYSGSRGIIVVFDIAQGQTASPILVHNPQANITDDFMKEYNKVNPVAAAPPSPAPNK
ncbi:MAG: OmpH family outer membrane protein [Blastocatellia bacterium]|nr:OmpH family outer membrane protein [Blastocatellia bacterium]